MNVTNDDFWWLLKNHPLLSVNAGTSIIEGILEISAYYDRDLGQLFGSRHLTARTRDTFVADRFAIRMEFNAGDIQNWPRVYDDLLRYRAIARRHKIPIEDLHFYSTGEACLGLEYPWDPIFALEYFLTEIVVPFFYRLSYVDLYGLAAARADLWREYPHGMAGLVEHRRDVQLGLRARRASKKRGKRARIPVTH